MRPAGAQQERQAAPEQTGLFGKVERSSLLPILAPSVQTQTGQRLGPA